MSSGIGTAATNSDPLPVFSTVRRLAALPDELLLIIFSLLNARSSCALMNTCRTLNRVGKDDPLWRPLFLKGRHSELKNVFVACRLGQVARLGEVYESKSIELRNSCLSGAVMQEGAVVVGDQGGDVYQCDPETGESRFRLGYRPDPGSRLAQSWYYTHLSPIERQRFERCFPMLHVAAIPGGKIVTAVNWDAQSIRIISVKDAKRTQPEIADLSSVTCIATTPTGDFLSGTQDGHIFPFSCDDHQFIRGRRGIDLQEMVTALTVGPNNHLVASTMVRSDYAFHEAGYSGKLHFWDASYQDGAAAIAHWKASSPSYAIAVAADGSTVAAQMHSVSIRRCVEGKEPQKWPRCRFLAEVTSVAMQSEGGFCLLGYTTGVIEMRSLFGKQLACFNGHTEAVTFVGLLPDRGFVSGSKDKTLRVWKLNQAKLDAIEGVSKEASSCVIA